MSRPARSTNSVSLFPFLAVLVCAMGALIFLLLVTTHRIRQQARAQVVPVVQVEQVEVVQPLEDPGPPPPVLFAPEPVEPEPQEPLVVPQLTWQPPARIVIDQDEEVRERIAMLAGYRDVGRQQIAARQATLQSRKRDILENQTQLRETEAHLKAFRDQQVQDQELLATLTSKQERLQHKLIELERELAQTQQQKGRASTKYAIIPFDGQLGTTRRPILIDCSSRGLRFLPEDILLESDDLDGFTIRRNPVLAGTRALVDHWKSARRRGEPPEPDPYVLLIVRPSGSLAYYAARKLLARLDQPSGYELVAENWELDLPPADPDAVATCRNAIDRLINEQQRMLALLEESRRGAGRTGRGGRVIRFDNQTGLIDVDEAPAGGGGDRFGSEQRDASPSGPARETLTRDFDFDSANSENTADFDRTGNAFGDRQALPPLSSGRSGADLDTQAPHGGTFEAQQPDATGRMPAFPGTQSNGRPVQPRALPQPSARQDQAPAQPGAQQRLASQRPDASQPRAEQPVARFKSPPRPTPDRSTDSLYFSRSGANSGARSGRESGQRHAESSAQDDVERSHDPRTSTSDRGDSLKRAKTYEFGARPGASVDQQNVPQDQYPSLKKTRTLSPRSDRRQQFQKRRWGLHGPRATIGFERQIVLQVESNELVLNQDRRLSINGDESSNELVTQVLNMIEAEVREWGWPPQNFYWVPTIRFELLPGGNQHFERIQGPLRAEGLSTTVVLQRKPGEE